MLGGRRRTIPGDVLLFAQQEAWSGGLIPNPGSLPRQMPPVCVLWSKYGFVFFVEQTGLGENTVGAGVQVTFWVGERKRNSDLFYFQF